MNTKKASFEAEPNILLKVVFFDGLLFYFLVVLDCYFVAGCHWGHICVLFQLFCSCTVPCFY